MFPSNYDPPAPEGPEAEMHRQRLQEEERRKAAADKLIASLTPEDARLELFSFYEIRRYGLRTRRKRGRDS